MAEERGRARRDLVVPYEHPYRHILRATWRHQRDVRLATALAGVLWLVALTNVLVGGGELALGAGLGAFLGTIALGLWIVAGIRTGWRMTRSWDRTTEL